MTDNPYLSRLGFQLLNQAVYEPPVVFLNRQMEYGGAGLRLYPCRLADQSRPVWVLSHMSIGGDPDVLPIAYWADYSATLSEWLDELTDKLSEAFLFPSPKCTYRDVLLVVAVPAVHFKDEIAFSVGDPSKPAAMRYSWDFDGGKVPAPYSRLSQWLQDEYGFVVSQTPNRL